MPSRFVLALSAALTALSVALSGFHFGIGNNLFHVSFVLSMEEWAVFRDDAFVQSLRNFTSAVWVLLRYVCTEGNVETVFHVSHIVSRAAAVLACLFFARMLGVGRLGLAVVGFAFVCSPLLAGSSLVAAHGMFVNYFTHSELTWPLIVVALMESHRGRLRVAAAVAGACFLVNAFIGVWLVAALAVGALLSRDQHRRSDLWQLPGIVALVCLPVAAWIAVALDSPQPEVAFSFRDYIRAYYAGHFLIEHAKPGALIELGAMTAAAVLCAIEISARRLKWEILGFAGVFVVGTVAPYVLDHRLIFNLHLLRVDGVIQFLFALVALVVAWKRINGTHWLVQATGFALFASVLNGMSAACVLVALLTPRWVSLFGAWKTSIVIILMAPVLDVVVGQNASFTLLYPIAGIVLVDALAESARSRPALAYLGLAVLVIASVVQAVVLDAGLMRLATLAACWAFALSRLLAFLAKVRVVLPLLAGYLAAQCVGIAVRLHENSVTERDQQVHVAEFKTLTDWLRSQPPRGPLLAPLETNPQPGGVWMPSRVHLQLQARQPVWVDWKRGAAVMWQPSFYAIWRPRFEAVKKLQTDQQYYEYAESQGIRWMLLPSDKVPDTCPGAYRVPLFQAGRYRICEVATRSPRPG